MDISLCDENDTLPKRNKTQLKSQKKTRSYTPFSYTAAKKLLTNLVY